MGFIEAYISHYHHFVNFLNGSITIFTIYRIYMMYVMSKFNLFLNDEFLSHFMPHLPGISNYTAKKSK